MNDEIQNDVLPLGRLTIDELKSIWKDSPADLEKLSQNPLARTYVPRNAIEGDYLVGVLNQEGIPALFHSHTDTAYGNLFVPAQGAGVIITLHEDAQRALTLIETLIETIDKQPPLSEDSDPVEP